MSKINCPTVGYLTGILHDVGKSGKPYQEYLSRIREGKPYHRGEVNHSAAGAIIMNQRYKTEKNIFSALTMQLICEAILCHHSSLLDNVDETYIDGYEKRLNPESEIDLQEAQYFLYVEMITEEEMDKKFKQARIEIEELFCKIGAIKLIDQIKMNAENTQYTFGLVQKYLSSCLVDADWLDSFGVKEKFHGNNSGYIEEELCRNRDRVNLWKEYLSSIEFNLKNKSVTDDDSLNYWRSWISDKCKEASKWESGIYTLCCPTGAGKTLTSLRYALAHGIECKKTKIFYIVPYISILEQNAESVRNMLNKNSLHGDIDNNVLELHSGYVEECRTDMNSLNEDLNRSEEYKNFMVERMISPIIFTTMVRFLNTFFAGGTRNLRPAHQFQDAIIIFDEIQSLPIRVVGMFNGLLNFLSEVCNCTCILCSATQPLLHETEYPIFPLKAYNPISLVDIPSKAYEIFKRVNIIPLFIEKQGEYGYRAEKIAELTKLKAKEEKNVLVIMNTKKSALRVFQAIDRNGLEDYQVIYLSTLLYPKHRKDIITRIKELLKRDGKLIVISTQLVEAGVDMSFRCVIRALAGMDSIIQAAGRCNREGENSIQNVYIVNPSPELEDLSNLIDVKHGADCSRTLIDEFKNEPTRFEGDLLSEVAMSRYYKIYFHKRQNEMHYNIPKINDYTLYDLLASNTNLVRSAINHSNYIKKPLNQSFKTAGELFKAIENIGQSVFVPKGGGREILYEIEKGIGGNDYKKLLQKAQQYVVNLSKQELKKLGSDKGILTYNDYLNMYVVNDIYYDDDTGLTGEVASEIQLCQF